MKRNKKKTKTFARCQVKSRLNFKHVNKSTLKNVSCVTTQEELNTHIHAHTGDAENQKRRLHSDTCIARVVHRHTHTLARAVCVQFRV